MVKSIKKLLKRSWRKLLVSAYVLYTVVAPLSSVQNIALAADTFCVGVTPGCVADLQSAITAAADGDTINIEAGTFNPTSTVNVNKSLTIVGAGVDSTIINASGYAGYGMNITASGVSLSGFTFTGANHYGLKISNASNIALTNLKVTNSARTNIDFNGVDNVTVNNVISSGAVSGTGLSITDGENYTISNITTSGNAWASMALYTSHWYAPAGINNVSLTNHTYSEAVGLYSEVENVGDPITNINVYPEFAYSVANSAAPKVVVYYPAAAYTTAWFVAGNTVMELSDDSQIYPDVTAPSVPVLTWPIDGAYTNDNTPLMQWDDSTDLFGIAGYYYRVYFNCSDLNNPATCTSVWPSATGLWRASSEYQAGTTANNTFYWQVMAQDNSGNQSAWSELEKLVIDTVAPAKVTLVAPLNNSFANGASLTNSWNPVADAASYVYESYHNEALTNVRWTQTVTGTSKTATNVAEATFWWRVRAVDAAGNLGEWSDAWKVTVDNTGPVAPVIVTPVEGDAFNSAPILNDWTDVTDQAGISKYRIQYEYDDLHTFSGAPYRETAGNVSQRNHVPAVSEEGGVKFRVQAFDGAGNEGTWSEWVHYYYDLTAPITVFYTPFDGEAQNVPFEVTGYTEDAVGVSQTMLYYSVAGDNNWVLIDTSAELMNHSGSKTFDWSYNWTPSTNGTYDLMAKAYDTAGNLESTAYVYGLVYDTVKPLAAITAPATGLLTNDGITVLGTASDELSGVAKVEIRFRNTDTGVICKEAGANRRPAAYDDMTGTWSYDYPVAQCPDGAYQVTAFVTDNAGNERAVNVNVVLDTTAPAQPTWGTIWNRTNGAEITCGGYTNTTQIKLDWNANTESDLVGYWFGTKNNDHHAYVAVDYYNGNMTPGNNPYYYTVIAVDAAGNESLISNQCGVTLDQVNPISDITSHEDGDIVKGNVSIAGVVSDDVMLLRYFLVITNSANAQVAGPGTVYNDGPVVNVSLNWNTTAVADGTYTIKLEARDKALNKGPESSDWVTVVVDNTAPVVNFTTPENDSRHNSDVVFGGDLSDATSGVDFAKITVTKDDESVCISDEYVTYNFMSGTWGYTLPVGTCDDGYYTVTVVAYDNAGNTTETALNIYLDTATPVVTQPVMAEAYYEGDAFPEVHVVVTDEKILELCYEVNFDSADTSRRVFGDIDSSCFTVDDSIIEEYGLGDDTSYTWYLEPAVMNNEFWTMIDTAVFDEGTYTFRYFARDVAGNESDIYETEIVIVNVAPELTFGETQTIVEGDEAAFSGSFTDPSYMEDYGDLLPIEIEPTNYDGMPADDSVWTAFISYGDSDEVLFKGFETPGEIDFPSYKYMYNGEYTVTAMVCESSYDDSEVIVDGISPMINVIEDYPTEWVVGDGFGDGECDIKTVIVTVSDLVPTVVLTATPNTAVLVGTAVTVTASPAGGNPDYTYLWSGDCTGTSTSATVNPTTARVYNCSVIVTDVDGDTASSSYAFTANNPVVPAVVPQGEVQGAQDEEVVPAEETPVDDGDVKGETCTEVKLYGYVYVDENDNGKFDKDEQVFENVTVKVMDSKDKLVEELETNKDGMWETMLCTGKYSVEVSKDTIEDGYKAVKGSYDVTLTEDENELNVSFELVEQKSLLDYWWILLLALLVLVGGAYGYKKFRDSK